MAARRIWTVLLLAATFGPAGFAAEPDPLLALKTRSALADDPELKGLNLFVSVVDGAAVVGGPVPDADLIPRVEAAARKVPGLSGVKVSCWVPAAENPLTRMVADRLMIPPLPSPPARPPAGPAPPLALAPRPAAGDPRPVGRVTVQRVTPLSGMAGFLLDPIAPGVTALPMPAPAGTPTAYPTIPAPAVPTRPADSFEAAVAELRRTPRFAGLTVALKDGTATIAGVATRDDDPWALADAVRKLPGVARVVVGAVKAP